MNILSKYKNIYGCTFLLAECEKDFFAFGSVGEFNSFWGVIVNNCGTIEEVKNRLNRLVILVNSFLQDAEKNRYNTLVEQYTDELKMYAQFINHLGG